MQSNPYTANYVESYYAQLSPEEKAMLSPMYQNIGQQQNFQTQAAQQGNALTQAAGQTAKSGGGMNALALASMLRKKKPEDLDGWQTEGSTEFSGANNNGMGSGEMYSGMNADLGLTPVKNMPVVGAYGQLIKQE